MVKAASFFSQILHHFPRAEFESLVKKHKAEDILAKVERALAGADVVLNCIGSFYKFVKPVLTAVFAARVNYVDICDDYDVTIDILKMHPEAKKRGVKALIGMGNSPGATNLLGKFAAENLFDETDSIDIFHAHGGEPVEGLGVIGHRFHCMTGKIPMFLDGKLRWVKFSMRTLLGIKLRRKGGWGSIQLKEPPPYLELRRGHSHCRPGSCHDHDLSPRYRLNCDSSNRPLRRGRAGAFSLRPDRRWRVGLSPRAPRRRRTRTGPGAGGRCEVAHHRQ